MLDRTDLSPVTWHVALESRIHDDLPRLIVVIEFIVGSLSLVISRAFNAASKTSSLVFRSSSSSVLSCDCSSSTRFTGILPRRLRQFFFSVSNFLIFVSHSSQLESQ